MLHLRAFDAVILNALSQIVSAPTAESAWQQAGLPIRSGGLGLTHSTPEAATAFASPALSFLERTIEISLPHNASRPSDGFINAVTLLKIMTSCTVPITGK